MKTQKLYEQGVSIWLDNITRKILENGTLKNYIEKYFVCGLTSNPTIFDNAIAKSDNYDGFIQKSDKIISDEELFFNLAIEDIQNAADLFLPIFEKTNGVDGFVSIEVSPLLAYDTEGTINAARNIFKKVNRPNAFIKIPGTPEGLPAIEQVIFEGIPVNVTLLFSVNQYTSCVNAFLNGIERRVEAGLSADVRSVASLFVSRWDRTVKERVPSELQNKLGLAVAKEAYISYLDILKSDRVKRLMNRGLSPQRLLWASTGVKDPEVSDVLYIENLVAPFTVNTMPEATLLAFAEHGNSNVLLSDKPDSSLTEFYKLGLDMDELALQLQKEGAESFIASWNHLLSGINQKRNSI